ncbi:MAG TPA: PH domain-containing protein [Bryobacteraceae bacterium]|nr:PH domain-containing protein [Bryobacteraceae bacterium]
MPSQEQFAAAPYDNTTKIASFALIAVIVVVTLATRSAIAVLIGGLIVALAYAWSPRGYTVAGRAVTVRRLIGKARIPLDGIREARTATQDDLRGAIRLFGNGGLFGYYGIFRTMRLGKCSWYLTNRSEAIVVITSAKTALFSPVDREGFLAAIRATVPVPLAPPAGTPAAYDSGRSFRVGSLFGIVAGAIALAVVVLAFSYSPGPPDYTLTPASLAIHDRFYPVTVEAANVDVSGIRVIDLRQDPQWKPTGRTNGFANAHYSSGWFEVAGGERVRLYTAGSPRLVLLPAKGRGVPVLLQVQDPQSFVARIRKEWSPHS